MPTCLLSTACAWQVDGFSGPLVTSTSQFAPPVLTNLSCGDPCVQGRENTNGKSDLAVRQQKDDIGELLLNYIGEGVSAFA